MPKLEGMEPLPPNCNPFHHDLYNMGCEVSGGWMAMFNQHAGIDRGGVFHPEPSYIIMVNVRTGQRFKMIFNSEQFDPTETMNTILKERQEAGYL